MEVRDDWKERLKRLHQIEKAVEWFQQIGDKYGVTEEELLVTVREARRELVAARYPFLGRGCPCRRRKDKKTADGKRHAPFGNLAFWGSLLP